MSITLARRGLLRGLVLISLLGFPALALAALAIVQVKEPAILFYATLPRIVAALVCGCLLGVAGGVFQRTFDNPLAEPSLLGISGGAALCLAASLVFAPVLWSHGYQIVALAGALIALATAFAVAWGPHLSSQTLVLAGVMINLFCNAAYAGLVLFNHDFLSNLLTWQAGSLQQSGWAPSLRLAVLAALSLGPLLLLERPLRLLSLGDGAAVSLGLSVRRVKLILLLIASLLAASVTAEFGQIGLVGLAAPALARAIWRETQAGLIRCGVTGALLLLLTDQVMRLLSSLLGDLPVGAAAGLLAGPLLVVLARRTPLNTSRPIMLAFAARGDGNAKRIMILALLLLAAFAIAAFVGRGPEGWSLAGRDDLALIWRWRLPPLLAASGAGLCLAVAGFILQRLLRNPLASPDLLGISHGAGLALAVAFVILPTLGVATKLAVTSAGAIAALLVVTLLGLRARFEPTRMLLLGVGLASMANAMLVIALAGGGQRGAALLGWFSGMTAGVDLGTSLAACVVGFAGLLACLSLHRQMDLISLGDSAATGFGLRVAVVRAIGIALAAILTAAGTMVVGPISFIGLMVPHAAAILGFRRTAGASLASGLIGALLMALAEWLSRNLVWPWALSPSLLAALVAGPWFLWQLRRQQRQ
jgi:ferric hydroxamate transport system permease protein